MRNVLSDLLAIWRSDGVAGVATVVCTFRFALRPGASMVVAPDGTVSGSVSGGCVEGAVCGESSMCSSSRCRGRCFPTGPSQS